MSALNRKTINDIIEWDVENWGNALSFWEENFPVLNGEKPLKCLELGGRNGGPSLWLALKGHHVVCSDIENPEPIASKLHQQYTFDGVVEYAQINALQIPYESHFDVIIAKSIVGGISRNGQDHIKKEVIDQVIKALKPGGIFLMAENMQASPMHTWARQKFVNWGDQWNYFTTDDLELLSQFEKVHCKTTGFFATFGRNEKQRKSLGVFDQVLEPLIPETYRYVLIAAAQKSQ